MSSRVVVATAGTDSALGALRITRALAERDGREVSVVAVVEPVFLEGIVLYSLGDRVVQANPGWLERTREAVRRQLRRIGGPAAGWPVHVEVGHPARGIAAHAEGEGAELILLGHGRHGLADRLFGRETAMQVMHLARVPVFAVPATASQLPRTAVVAVDFSRYSHDAASAVLGIVADHAAVHLVHADWSPEGTDDSEPGEWFETYRAGTRVRLQEFRAGLRARPGVRLFTSVVPGEAADGVLQRAREVYADVIASGSHGFGFVNRTLTGSVSTRLVRAAECGVLVAPPRTAAPGEHPRAGMHPDGVQEAHAHIPVGAAL